jgi:hypothetical protein
LYSTCLFCNASLGHNEAIEHFPVGRRLAFDAAKGRLWVVCRACERWNLTPLEERWEAIEECERAFRETRLRVSTDEIGLARLREGLELVRIGAPQRPEMAAWRYGDQFGRRRRKTLLVGGGIAAVAVGWVVAGPVLGIVGGVSPLLVDELVVRGSHVDNTQLLWDAGTDRWALSLSHDGTGDGRRRWWRYERGWTTSTLTGDDAVRAARLLLPAINASGASQGTVRKAVDYMTEQPDPEGLFTRAARAHAAGRWLGGQQGKIALRSLPAPVRLALEMSAHEETERRALEGELHLLESSWRDAEEIAAIADDMFLPASVDAELDRLKRLRDSGG